MNKDGWKFFRSKKKKFTLKHNHNEIKSIRIDCLQPFSFSQSDENGNEKGPRKKKLKKKPQKQSN